jgi:hypothetical protein
VSGMAEGATTDGFARLRRSARIMR